MGEGDLWGHVIYDLYAVSLEGITLNRAKIRPPGASQLRSGPGLMQEGVESGLRDSGRLWQVVGLHSVGVGVTSQSVDQESAWGPSGGGSYSSLCLEPS